jgi:YidC/Oxa1 family membrane protein insertase
MIRAASTLRSYQRHAVHSKISSAATSLSTSSLEEEQSTKCHALPRINAAGIYGFQGNVNTIQKRYKSTDANQGGSVENTLDKLFEQQEAKGEGDEWFLDQAADAWEPTWYNLADQAVNAVQNMHEITGLHYAGSIVAVTCALRLAILPVAVRAQRAASRMGHLQPELALIKKRYEVLGTPTQAEQKAFAESMRSLFKKYEVSPFAAMAGPLIQAPLFIGMFFGMKKMPELFTTEMSTGGLAWFTDLTIPDPTYVLPVACGLSFLATIESGKEQMIDGNPQYGPVLVNAFRGMCFVMVPVMTTFPAIMLCYWVPNNFITLVQSVTLRNTWVKKQLGIWDRPKPIPGATPDVGIQKTVENLVKQVKGEPTTEAERMKRHNEDIETKKQVEQMSKATRARRRQVSTSASTRKR